MSQLVDIQSPASRPAELLVELFFCNLPSLDLPLPSFIQQKGFRLGVAPSTQLRNILAHLLVREIDEDITHIKEAGLDCHCSARLEPDSRDQKRKSGVTEQLSFATPVIVG
jgi:hypothetical protein